MVQETKSKIYEDILKGLEFTVKKWLKDVINEDKPLIQVTTLNDPEEKFTRTQLANYLNVTLPTVDRYRAKCVFPVYQTGRTIYFKKSEVDKALLVGQKKGAFK